MSKRIKILLVKPNEAPQLTSVENDIFSLQEVVGGSIECIELSDANVVLICNEEGKFNGSSPNRLLEGEDLIYGTFFICGLSKNGDYISISNKMADKYKEEFRC